MGAIYASAQGPISVGGYSIEKMRGPARKKNHSLVGNISDGAIVKKEISNNDLNKEELRISLNQPDFTSAMRVCRMIDSVFGEKISKAEDASTITISMPADYYTNGKLVEFISIIEMLNFTPSTAARVVINDKTGTVVVGGDVRINQVAVSHGNISIEIHDSVKTSQPAPLSAGQTVVSRKRIRMLKKKRAKWLFYLIPPRSTIWPKV